MPIYGQVVADNTLSFRNILINGDMNIYQRGQTATGLTGEQYGSADRMKMLINTAGTWSMNVVSDGPSGTGFRNSCNVICTSADSSLASGDYVGFSQLIEGQNLQATKKGTANAESITVSFWAKSSNTGTYVCELFDGDNTRQAAKSYVINTANTWEKKEITFTPDTTGQFDNDNSLSLYCLIWLAAGSTYTSGTLSNGSWASSVQANRAVGQLNLANRVGNYMAITGWQLEVGSVATPFERRPYGTELNLCQRYYEGGDYGMTLPILNSSVVASFLSWTSFNVSKRAVPTITGTNDQGTFSASAYINGGAFGRSNTVANRVNSGTFKASAEL